MDLYIGTVYGSGRQPVSSSHAPRSLLAHAAQVDPTSCEEVNKRRVRNLGTIENDSLWGIPTSQDEKRSAVTVARLRRLDMKRSKSVSSPPPSDFTKPRPKRGPGANWKDGLVRALNDPDQIFETDELTVTLKDGFPKAKYHYLIVPRESINSVKELSRRNLDLLNHIHKVAEDLISRVHKKEPGLRFRFGYHAVPSMNRLHMHIISQDFDSPRMRTRHHWNTFNTEYFMDSTTVTETLKSVGYIEVDEEKYEALLTLQMKCNICPRRYEDMTALKSHLMEHCKPPRGPPTLLSASVNTGRARRWSWKY